LEDEDQIDPPRSCSLPIMKWTEPSVPDIDDEDMMEQSVDGGWHLNLTRDFNTEVQEFIESKQLQS